MSFFFFFTVVFFYNTGAFAHIYSLAVLQGQIHQKVLLLHLSPGAIQDNYESFKEIPKTPEPFLPLSQRPQSAWSHNPSSLTRLDNGLLCVMAHYPATLGIVPPQSGSDE